MILANQMLKKSRSESENISLIKLRFLLKIVREFSTRIKLQLYGIYFN